MINRLFQKKSPTLVGIDIGSHCVKAVLLSKADESYQLDAVAIEPLPKGAMSERSIPDVKVISKVISKLMQRLPKKVEFAAIAISGQTVITKIIFMDASLSDIEMESQIAIEADSLIPYPLDEVSLDFEKISLNEADPSKMNVLLSAARTDAVNERIGALEDAKLAVKVVDVETYALSRALEVIYPQLPANAYDKVVAIIDLGAVITLLSVVQSGKTLYTREQVFGGEQYTNSIVSYYNKPYDEAELEKTTGDLPANYLFEVLAPFQTSLLQQVRRALQMFMTTSGKDHVDYIVLTGGTSIVEGLDKLMIDELGTHTIIADPFESMQISNTVDRQVLQNHKPQFAIATGLALRSFSSCHI
jgi:type IV pilus assembly protein PilM